MLETADEGTAPRDSAAGRQRTESVDYFVLGIGTTVAFAKKSNKTRRKIVLERRSTL